MTRVICLAATALLSACAAQMLQLASPMSVADADADAGLYHLDEGVTIKVTHADPVELRAGTTWRQIGTVEHGSVFDTKDQVVVVNSFDVHEAAVVIRDTEVVGFYLKAQKTFVEAKAVPIALRKGE